MPIILIGITASLFFMFTNPIYNDIANLKAQVGSYDDALSNSKMLENERDKLTAKYNDIDPSNLTKLEKFLPQNVDNIRLVLEIEQVATPYGMILKDVRYNTPAEASAGVGAVTVQGSGNTAASDYGVFELQFSTSGTYNNFIDFTKDLEKNLRIVDISAISFSSNTSGAGLLTQPNSSETYKYDFKIKTYYLKN
jgi:Tfp pilus assembly protein PilO